ncbi:MAG: pectate lyase, partial [Bacteroidales bacterium]|nr:pectate lyase [Bacteroidales bacterium]
DYRNNVVYNWGSNSGYGGEATNANIVANYNKPGPATRDGQVRHRIYEPWKKAPNDNPQRFGEILDKWGTLFVEGNYVYGHPQTTENNWEYGIQIPERYSDHEEVKAILKLNTPLPAPPITQHSAEVAYERVMAYGGASLVRDAIDSRIIHETRTGTHTFSGSNGSRNGIIDSQRDVGGWIELRGLPPLESTANDGIPDAWKIANGLDIETPIANEKDLSPIYTNLEVYLNSLVQYITMLQEK